MFVSFFLFWWAYPETPPPQVIRYAFYLTCQSNLISNHIVRFMVLWGLMLLFYYFMLCKWGFHIILLTPLWPNSFTIWLLRGSGLLSSSQFGTNSHKCTFMEVFHIGNPYLSGWDCPQVDWMGSMSQTATSTARTQKLPVCSSVPYSYGLPLRYVKEMGCYSFTYSWGQIRYIFILIITEKELHLIYDGPLTSPVWRCGYGKNRPR